MLHIDHHFVVLIYVRDDSQKRNKTDKPRLADKSDVRRSRVRNKKPADFDIHDRVNSSVAKADLKINEAHSMIELKLQLDTHVGSVMEYFEIFMERMILCRKAAEMIGLKFKLTINDQQLI